mgnify:CR=1 FL=1
MSRTASDLIPLTAHRDDGPPESNRPKDITFADWNGLNESEEGIVLDMWHGFLLQREGLSRLCDEYLGARFCGLDGSGLELVSSQPRDAELKDACMAGYLT